MSLGSIGIKNVNCRKSCCFTRSVQLKSGPSTKPWIFHFRCYL